MASMVPGDGNRRHGSTELPGCFADVGTKRRDLRIYPGVPAAGAAEAPADDADLDPCPGRVLADHRPARVALAGVDATPAGTDLLGGEELDAGLLVLGRTLVVGHLRDRRVAQFALLLGRV